MIGIPGLSIPRRRRRASFTGAYDAVPSIVAAYGMRRLRTAYTGSLLRMRRSSDNAESDFGYTGSGDLDTAAIVAWLSGSGYIVKWYDQSGNGYDAVQTTAASQPLYVASGQNGRPVLRWDGVDDILPTTLPTPSTLTLVAAAQKATQTTDAASLIRPFLASSLSPNPGGIVAGTVRSSAANPNQFLFAAYNDTGLTPTTTLWTDGTFAILSGVANGASSVAAYNGASVSGTVQNSAAGVLEIGGSTSLSVRRFAGDIAELIICNAALSTGDRSAAEAAANDYWSIY